MWPDSSMMRNSPSANGLFNALAQPVRLAHVGFDEEGTGLSTPRAVAFLPVASVEVRPGPAGRVFLPGRTIAHFDRSNGPYYHLFL